jgi:hypothetical protein
MARYIHRMDVSNDVNGSLRQVSSLVGVSSRLCSLHMPSSELEHMHLWPIGTELADHLARLAFWCMAASTAHPSLPWV